MLPDLFDELLVQSHGNGLFWITTRHRIYGFRLLTLIADRIYNTTRT